MKFEQWWEKNGKAGAVRLFSDDYERPLLDVIKITAYQAWQIAMAETLRMETIRRDHIEE